MKRNKVMDEDKKKTDKDVVPSNVEQKLFDARIITLFGEINMEVAKKTISAMLAMAGVNDEPITLVINSPGGHVEAGDTIYDMIKFIKPEVRVLGTGWVASIATLIYLGAKKHNRYCLPNTRFLIHQPLGGAQGYAVEIDIQARQILKMKERLNRIISAETGQSYERVAKDAERDYWLFAEEAKDYGIVTHIVQKQSEVN
jgi:ATP-dependent Clp protease, protease subunit